MLSSTIAARSGLLVAFAALILPTAVMAQGVPVAICPAPEATAQTQAEIRAALERWRSAFNNGDWPATLDIVAPDNLGWIEDGGIVDYAKQRELADRQISAKAPARGKWEIQFDEIIVCGDLAIARDTATWTGVNKEGSPSRSALRTFEIFRRQSDGSWKISRFIDQSLPVRP